MELCNNYIDNYAYVKTKKIFFNYENGNDNRQIFNNNQNINTASSQSEALNDNQELYNEIVIENKTMNQLNICLNCDSIFPLEYDVCPNCVSNDILKLVTSLNLQENITDEKKLKPIQIVIIIVFLASAVLLFIFTVVLPNKVSKTECGSNIINNNKISNTINLL